MPHKPKILQAVSEMMAQGLSDQQIIDNLRAVGLSDDQIKKVMQVAGRDVYSRFKREMASFVDTRIKSNDELIGQMVDRSLAGKKDELRGELSDEVQEVIGDLAKEVNSKARDMDMTVKKIREENLEMRKLQQVNRADLDLLLAGPFKYRLAISVIFLAFGSLIFLFDIFFFFLNSPSIIDHLTAGASGVKPAAIQAILFTAVAAFSIASLAVGVYFSGRPGRQ